MVLGAGAAGLVFAEPLIRAMDQLTGAIKQSYEFTGKAEKASAALGLSFNQGLKKMGPSITGLRGTIEQQYTTGILMLDKGLRGNAAAVGKLVNQQMLTGTAYKGTIEQFARMQVMGGLSIEATNELATETREVGYTYGISTDKLIKALDTLKAQEVFLGVAGMTKSMGSSIVKLQATLGAAFDTQSIGKMMNMIVNTGTKGLQTLTALGIGDVRTRLERHRGDEVRTFAILKEAIMTAGTTLKGFVGDSSLQFGAFTSQLDPAAQLLIPAMERLAEGTSVNAKAQVKFADLMTTLWSEVWNPIKTFVMSMQPQLKSWAKTMSSIAQWMVGNIARFFKQLAPVEKVFDSFMHTVVNVTYTVSEVLWTKILEIKNVFTNILIPVILNVVAGLGGLYTTLKEFIENASTGFKNMLIGGGAAMAAAILAVPTGGLSLGLLAGAGLLGAGAVGVGQYMGGDSAADMTNSLMTEALIALEDAGANMGAYSLEQEKIGNKVTRALNPLLDIQASINSQTDTWRDEWNSIDALTGHIAESVASIDDKTVDARVDSSDFLSLTDEFLATSMDQILGLTAKDEQGFMHGLGDAMETLVELTVEGNTDRKKTKNGARSVKGL